MITKADVVAKVRELAEDSPDYIYQAVYGFCKNYHIDEDGNPIEGSGCIVGQALHEVGFSYAEIPQTANALKALNYLGLTSEGSREDNWLETVQSYQDNGYRWGAAVEAADHKYPLMET